MVLNRLLYGLQRRGYVSCSRSWSCRHPCVARHSQSDVLRVSASIHFHVAIQVFVFDHRRRGSSRWLQTETRQVCGIMKPITAVDYLKHGKKIETGSYLYLETLLSHSGRDWRTPNRTSNQTQTGSISRASVRFCADPAISRSARRWRAGNLSSRQPGFTIVNRYYVTFIRNGRTDLKAAIEGPLYRDALAGMGPVRRYRRNQAVQLIPLLLQRAFTIKLASMSSRLPFDGRFTFNFFTRLSMARLEKLSDSPPWRWHIKLCTMLRHASALVGLLLVIRQPWSITKKE